MSTRRIFSLLIALGPIAASAKAQDLVGAERLPAVVRLMDGRAKDGGLKCNVEVQPPLLDFNFRYITGFGIAADFAQFTPGEELLSVVRVTPEGSQPVFLAESFDVPDPLKTSTEGVQPKDLTLELSGGFAVGEGKYGVELLLLDKRGYSCFKQWNVKTAKYRRDAVAPILQPLTVRPLLAEAWDGNLEPKGLRLTVLLDVTPLDPRAAKLHAWDRSFLLQGLASLLKQLPCRSVKIVAFSIGQQNEIYRQESFDAAGFRELGGALKKLELATVSYRALLPGNSVKFLANLTAEQTATTDPPDAIVFIGANTAFSDKIPKGLLETIQRGTSQFFYFEYLGFRMVFPDSIEHLTRDLHGTVFHIDSANQLGQAIEKMLAQLKPIQNGAAAPGQ